MVSLFMINNTFRLTLMALTFAGGYVTSAPTQAATNVLSDKAETIEKVNTKNIALSGVIKQGGLIVGKTLPSDTVKLNGKTLMVSAKGDYTFGFSRDDKQSHKLVITSINGDRVEKILIPEQREYNIQRIEGIKKSIMQPNPKAAIRARKDSTQVKAARKIASSLDYFAQGFIPPIEGTITGVYGSQRVYNGVPKNPHFGLDYAGNTGDPVKAPASGTVLLWVPDMFYSGGTMIIDHGQGVSSTFLHLSDSYVKKGDKVTQGQVVAAVGQSGRATGPHLDWRINWFDVRIDPALVLELQPLKTVQH
ncbi:M23 family metallopeptidase [Colwellia sp. 4_MG-2023]|uniref:M23 family metallopeptidase n=1 Tax=unclassified Colwellia TaxID=196834 RepID=UPI0026E2F207|nr:MULTISPECIES: M23 family metallopeptidase [unclassified Colwellia]MDO6507718.1 M23 family metallopeptidase [Colwellia sp. 5_MG-2023]MDO6556320.1 M23 family metallopeptidase [Colwellia sp. 4_MG-2023]